MSGVARLGRSAGTRLVFRYWRPWERDAIRCGTTKGNFVATIYYEKDANPDLLQGKTVAILGYGSQGHAHALNLRDSGVSVIVGLHEGSKSRAKAEAQGLKVVPVAEATRAADVIMVLIPDHLQQSVFESEIGPNLSEGKTLMFAHGFSIHFGTVQPT